MYDAKHVKTMASLIQGALAASVAWDNFPAKVTAVEQDKDGDGNYLPYFTVVLFSGARIRVTVAPESGRGTTLDMEFEQARQSLEGGGSG